MPTDTARHELTISAPAEQVLAAVRDVAGQARWSPSIREAQVLETTSEGLPKTARFAASTAVGTDRYTLAYTHTPDGLNWSLLEGRLQTGQEGRYLVRAAGVDTSIVDFELTIHHNLPLPGFIRRRVIDGLVTETLQGLKADLERPT
ncbi:polyketide cyclase [Intrasporangium chromatireducens Q5-1]|uniref:Polyketide cyclase n=1 Tax=Intrasporangium chromatireducens Q5-1 TaxID=584657 RepID=W9GRA0_9MICO|nr:SRPBCC family protein [Intrasporangium chromatireducens]EWT07363.1 polyketide cyclase [Intrasporangium chromatireducens Q5-1]